jgi:diguanylate cyclase (GGDEF)-like protein
MAKMFQACTDFDEAIKVAEYELQRLFPEHVGTLYIMKESRNQLDRAMAWGDPTGSVESFTPDNCWALRFGRPHHFHFGAKAVACSHVESGQEGDELLCLPIVAYGETLGTLCLQRGLGEAEVESNRDAPSAERLQFCATVTESLALAIANLRLRETLRHQALRDPLTGLFNRRYLTDSLERELERAESLDRPLSVVMFDIDFFKRFNDEFGHDSGDAMLSSLGALLKKHTRATDIVARYGGEEFALVMTDADADFAHDRVDALRQEVAALAVKHNGRSLGSVSISAGISVYPRDGDSPDDLFKVADTALYEAKHAGRNRVFVAGRIPAGDDDAARTPGSVDTAA